MGISLQISTVCSTMDHFSKNLQDPWRVTLAVFFHVFRLDTKLKRYDSERLRLCLFIYTYVYYIPIYVLKKVALKLLWFHVGLPTQKNRSCNINVNACVCVFSITLTKHGCTLQETQPLHTQQDKIVPHHKHHITLWPGISLALRESLRCGGTRPFSTLKKPSNKCKTTRQRSFEKNSWVFVLMVACLMNFWSCGSSFRTLFYPWIFEFMLTNINLPEHMKII